MKNLKKIVLTGSSSGFGLITAKTLAKNGHTVYATMRNINGSNAATAQDLTDWAIHNNVDIQVIELDVTSDSSVEKAFNKISNHSNGQIDVLINNAGISYVGVNETLSAEQTDLLFQINVIGVDRMIKAVLPFMHKQKSGLIINLSSVQSRFHTPIIGAYSATKAAVDALSVSYYYELRSTGIDVAIIQPGAYPTTDIVAKSLRADHPEAEALYGSDMAKVKAALIYTFTPKETNPDPKEVTDVIQKIVDADPGDRALWTVVGGGRLEAAVENINDITKKSMDMLLGFMGL